MIVRFLHGPKSEIERKLDRITADSERYPGTKRKTGGRPNYSPHPTFHRQRNLARELGSGPRDTKRPILGRIALLNQISLSDSENSVVLAPLTRLQSVTSENPNLGVPAMFLLRHTSLFVLFSASLVAPLACSANEKDGDKTCDPLDADACESLVCAQTEEGEFLCAERVVVVGTVSDTSDGAPIEGAHVIALDEEGAAVTDVAISDADGNFELELPVIRDADGAPIDTHFTLHAAAASYQPFPLGARVALPLSSEDSELEDDGYVLQSTLTAIRLIPLGGDSAFSLSGSVVGVDGQGNTSGILVVASGEAGTFSGISDRDGAFTIFNLLPGDYDVRAYGAGLQIQSETVSVEADVDGLELLEREGGTTTVHGNIQLVNAPGSAKTSVILVVEDTFEADAARGEVPRGLRAPRTGEVSIDGDFTIEGVPEGRYVVLAAYENDDLVRDPDTNISGTSFVTIDVDGSESEMTIDESFKVTEALGITFPGATGPEAVDEKPLLEWADDSSEDWYDLYVFDALGNEVYNALDIPGASGSETVIHQYDGPLEPGMYYQFRVSSWRQPGNGDAAPISSTEDLKGVFFLPVSDE